MSWKIRVPLLEEEKRGEKRKKKWLDDGLTEINEEKNCENRYNSEWKFFTRNFFFKIHKYNKTK